MYRSSQAFGYVYLQIASNGQHVTGEMFCALFNAQTGSCSGAPGGSQKIFVLHDVQACVNVFLPCYGIMTIDLGLELYNITRTMLPVHSCHRLFKRVSSCLKKLMMTPPH
jgi:hypothetical protein